MLLGARQVGKSTLIKSLQPELEINLADEVDFLRYSTDVAQFRSDVLGSGVTTIFMGEIRRLPKDIRNDDLTGLQFFLDQFEGTVDGAFVFHLGSSTKRFGKIWCLPWQQGLKQIGI